MKQVVLRTGAIEVVDVPTPAPGVGRILVANAASVISSGTERTAIASGGGGGPLPVRALRKPDLIRKGLEHLREHGVRDTLDLARGATAADFALGYSSAGLVLDTGGVAQFRVGQLVACGGAGSASHAEVVSVPAQLAVPVPEGVTPRQAAFTTLGTIALQGVRRASPSLGERVVVVGLGLVGLIAVQVLRAAGCPVLGVEPVSRRRELATALGAEVAVAPEEAEVAVGAWTEGVGADAVLVTAASSQSTVLNQAVAMLRRKGRVVAVGEIGLGLEREGLYVREADVLISTSYGPGRYDASYEEGGLDYPIAYVRWTENRNMGEVLRLLAGGQLDVERLIELERPLDRAPEAYAAINGPDPPLGAVLTYDVDAATTELRLARTGGSARPRASDGEVGIALIGAGGFVTAVHLPNLKRDPHARVVVVANRGSTSAGDAARAAGGADATTDWRAAIERPDVSLVVIGTRHNIHAEIAAAALEAGKAVFVEKPLGLSREEIDRVWRAGRQNDRLAIGFNRPFAPLAQALRAQLQSGPDTPLQVIYRVNAPLPADHWLNDPAIGGGRIQGEACHMFDFANSLCGNPLRVVARALPSMPSVRTVESASVTIEYRNGSLATVLYSGAGGAAMPKERIEVLAGGQSWVLDDFISLTSYLGSGTRNQKVSKPDKGHAALVAGVLAACRGDRPFEPGLAAAYAAQSVALAALESIASGAPVKVILPESRG